MTRTFKIGDRCVGKEYPPLVIAEMSGNHNQSLDRAIAIVDAAADAGAHALKLQTYTADTMTLDVRGGDFKIYDQSSLWAGKNLHDLYSEACTNWQWHEPIMERAKQHGLICFSSPFDESAVDFLETLNVPAYKIASFENNHHALIRKAAKTGKPLIVSTGMASIGEIEQIVAIANEVGCGDLALLKCTSAYPASPLHANISTIPHLRDLFGCNVGISDHTMGIGVSVAAVALGATIIEKHFTLSRSDGGVDSHFSLEPAELAALVQESERAWLSLGSVRYGPTDPEKKSIQFRRSIYASKDIKAGDVLNDTNMKIVRPGYGEEPRHYELLEGIKSPVFIRAGSPIKIADLLDSMASRM